MKKNNGFRIAIAVLLLLASQAAAALGLGQLRLKSGLGEPLLAEIPLVSSVPGELERLQVGLASPETFARIGLDPPEGVVADLQFNLALGDDGQPVIRITSTQPIHEPMLNFLVEADWGQGRLVREYSALVDAPRTVAAPLAPPVEAPVAAPSNTIVRPPTAPPPQESGESREDAQAAAGAEPGATADEGSPADSTLSTEPAPPPPAPAAPVAPAAPAAAVARPGQVRVQAGDTLSEITRDLDLGVSLEQAMIALLRSNPGAFIDGNVHMLRAGAVLRVPGEDAVGEVDAASALARVREQTRAWREATRTVPQPAVAADAAPSGATTEPAPGAREAGAGGADDGEAETPVADGRLEIVPPGAGEADGAGSSSGISDGGEGDTMRQQLQQANEALAAREAELEEVKSRLAELEEIQADQQQLISMKDNELASVQAELAQAREQADPGDAAPAGGAGWWIGGGLLLLLVLLGGWLMRRKAAPVQRFRAPDPVADEPTAVDARASAFPAGAPAAAATAPAWHAGPATDAGPAAAPRGVEATPPAPAPATPTPPLEPQPGPGPGAVPEAAPGHEPAVDTAPGAPAMPGDPGGEDGGEEFQVETPGHERLELARAYLDLGDRDSARQLLTELVVSGDLGSRQEAARMLRELD